MHLLYSIAQKVEGGFGQTNNDVPDGEGRNWYGRIPGSMQNMQGYILTYSRVKGENL